MGWDDDILNLDMYTDWKNSTYAQFPAQLLLVFDVLVCLV